jgi:hypothetical protein
MMIPANKWLSSEVERGDQVVAPFLLGKHK